jgi:hypothetical protein
MTTTGTNDWKKFYRLAVIEIDSAKLPSRISDARKSILDRIEETLWTPTRYDERQELRDALNSLHTLQQVLESRIHQAQRKAG